MKAMRLITWTMEPAPGRSFGGKSTTARLNLRVKSLSEVVVSSPVTPELFTVS